MVIKRTIRKLVGKRWVDCDLIDIKVGERFRIFKSNKNKLPVIDDIATDNAYVYNGAAFVPSKPFKRGTK